MLSHQIGSWIIRTVVSFSCTNVLNVREKLIALIYSPKVFLWRLDKNKNRNLGNVRFNVT